MASETTYTNEKLILSHSTISISTMLGNFFFFLGKGGGGGNTRVLPSILIPAWPIGVTSTIFIAFYHEFDR